MGEITYGKDLCVLISTFSTFDRITASKISFYNTDKCDLMCTPATQMITCYTVKPEWHKCSLNPQMFNIYDGAKLENDREKYM